MEILGAKGVCEKLNSYNNETANEETVLEPFKEATDVLEGEKYPTVQFVVLWLHKLGSHCNAGADDAEAGDPEELGALSDVFLKNRSSPLLIGSIKSNIGHAEGASGICSIIKSLLVFENNEIPPNLHYKNPNPKVPALSDGRLKISYEENERRLQEILQEVLENCSNASSCHSESKEGIDNISQKSEENDSEQEGIGDDLEEPKSVLAAPSQ